MLSCFIHGCSGELPAHVETKVWVSALSAIVPPRHKIMLPLAIQSVDKYYRSFRFVWSKLRRHERAICVIYIKVIETVWCTIAVAGNFLSFVPHKYLILSFFTFTACVELNHRYKILILILVTMDVPKKQLFFVNNI